MKIVIDITEEMYNVILSEKYADNNTLEYVARCIQNGMPLPKGHGRLIDASRLFKKLFINENGEVVPNRDVDNFEIEYGVEYVKNAIQEASTIIEADEEN